MAGLITSASNPLIKRIRALGHRKVRDEEGAFFVEGIRPVWLAVEAQKEIETLVVAPGLLKSERAAAMIEDRRRAGTPVAEVSDSIFERIGEREHPSGVGAIVHARLAPLEKIELGPGAFAVALLEVGNPGNLGTIIRTVDAAAGAGVILIGPSTDPFHPSAVKSSMGALFHVPIARTQTLKELADWGRSKHAQLVAASDHAPAAHWDARFRFPAVVLFGSEGEGLGEQEIAACDLAVRIPMSGSADSLNLAVAVGVLVYELKRRNILRSSGDE
ncbi:MAG: TrmH family RNA methyltransferase [Rudaea sp.]